MVSTKVIVPLVILAVLAWLTVTYIGVTATGWTGWLVGLGMAVGLVALLGLMGVPLPMLPGFTKKMFVIFIGIGITAFAVGTPLGASLFGGLKPGSIGGDGEPEVSTCWNSVSDQVRGLASTADVNAYDVIGTAPGTAVDVNPTQVYLDGVFQSTLTDTGANTANGSIGKVMCFYGGGTTYYGSKNCICMDAARPPAVLDAYAIVAESNMAVTGYQTDGVTALTTGTTDEEDYEIALGANEDTTFYMKLKNNVANKRYQLGAICTAKFNDIDVCALDEPGFTEVLVPNFIADAENGIQYNTSAVLNMSTGYDRCWVPAEPKVLDSWQEVKYKFKISSSSDGTDALDGASSASTSDLCVVMAFDSQWSKGFGADKTMYHDFYDHGVQAGSETNVGLSETLYSPYGKQVGMIVEGT